jgi:altronate dehydratase
MPTAYRFEEVGRLPLPGDNVAIATQLLEAGTVIAYGDRTLTLDYTVMEGHRFAVEAIAPGEPLLSWQLPFGLASRAIQPGNYVVNDSLLKELHVRSLDFTLPTGANFVDHAKPYVLDEEHFQPAPAPIPHPDPRTFLGYRRCPQRGVGTRNMVVLLGTTSRTGSYVKQLAARLHDEATKYANVDGIVPAAHTEGGSGTPNNLELLLRTLAGFIVNPNVGAILVVDDGAGPVTNRMVQDYLREHNYPLDDVIHRFLSLEGGFEDQLALGESIVRSWLPTVNAMGRTAESIRHLKIGLQCGGSDAFSGISANPLLGWISQELVRYGGAANLAETDELIGAESYVLDKVRDVGTARKFLTLMANFKERCGWHGASAEGNPSGGNKYRGLYNITLKSIGAAQKKDPATRLDYAIDYGEPMTQTGYYFMDSPGNDLESIAGQVACGCNMIFFTTGNGSITNFPFVPTIKVVTTTQRFQLLSNDMDVNAGQYQDGMPMEELGGRTFDLMVEIASGRRSVGELAGHAQVQIWRDWQQTDDSRLETLLRQVQQPKGAPIAIKKDVADGASSLVRFGLTEHGDHRSSDQIGLVLPTSLCAGQVANMIVAHMNGIGLGQPDRLSRFVTLAHTEGCGNSGGQAEEMYARTMIGYITHPLVRYCLLLEHGCEKTHNDFMRSQMEEMGVDSSRLGFASIQLDGGIDKVSHKVEAWFAERLAADRPGVPVSGGLEALRVGILSDGPVSAEAGEQLAELTKMIVGAGGLVVVPENSGLLSAAAYQGGLGLESDVSPSLAYGERARHLGFHVMETPTRHWVETVTGLAATGVELMIALAGERPMQTHPLVPMLQVASEPSMQQAHAEDMDLLLGSNPAAWNEQILQLCKEVIEHRYTPRLFQQGNVDFQFTRGYFGVSL